MVFESHTSSLCNHVQLALLTDAPLNLPEACTAGTLPEQLRTDLSWPPSQHRARKKKQQTQKQGCISRYF